jgi:hypothetical protein
MVMKAVQKDIQIIGKAVYSTDLKVFLNKFIIQRTFYFKKFNFIP